jgi:hypothetical protein
MAASLRTKLIRLAYKRPDLRAQLLPLVRGVEPHPGWDFYQYDVGNVEKTLRAQLGVLTRAATAASARAAARYELPLKTVRDRLLGDALSMEKILHQAYETILAENERRSKSTARYFERLRRNSFTSDESRPESLGCNG